MRILVTGDDGEVDAVVTLVRPLYHVSLAAYLAAWQDFCREEEGGPHEDRPVIPLPTRSSNKKALATQSPIK